MNYLVLKDFKTHTHAHSAGDVVTDADLDHVLTPDELEAGGFIGPETESKPSFYRADE